jgi:hypothetical protein
MQKKPHAKGAKGAKAKSDEGFWIPDSHSLFREWIDQRKNAFLRALRALCVKHAFVNCMDAAWQVVNSKATAAVAELDLPGRQIRRLKSVKAEA